MDSRTSSLGDFFRDPVSFRGIGRWRAFSVGAAAELLGVSTVHVINLIDAGRIVAMDLRGSGASRALYRIPHEALASYLLSCLLLSRNRRWMLRQLPRDVLSSLLLDLDALLSA